MTNKIETHTIATLEHEAISHLARSIELPLQTSHANFCSPTQSKPRGKTNNDPSAGSPTETLLRLLLPLNDQV